MFYFGGIIEWINIGLLIFVLIKLSSLGSRMNNLEKGKVQPSPAPVWKEEQIPDNKAPVVPAAPTFSQSPQKLHESDSFEKFFKWYAHEWMLKTGALFILLGFIWFVTYAFLHHWIGEVGRITVGLAAGAAILFFGEFRLARVRTQGITLVWLGAAVLTTTVYAAQNMYHMFTPTIALVFLAFVSALVAYISYKHNSLSLAVAGLVVGAVAPMLIASTDKSIFGLYSYLSVIVVGTIWIARHRRWQVLTFLALVITSLYSLPYFFTRIDYLGGSILPSELQQLRFFALFLASIFFLVNLLTIITNKEVNSVDMITAGAIGMYTYGWINGLVPHEAKSLVIVAAALFYSLASFATYSRTSLKQPVYLYTAIAVILLAIATAFQFKGPALVMAFSVQALILPIVGVRLLGANTGKYVLFYFILPFATSLDALLGIWRPGLFQDHFYALTIVTLALILSGVYFYYSKKEEDSILHDPSTILIVTGGVYSLFWIWRVAHAAIGTEYLATMATLVAYTAIGLFTYLTGEIQKRRILNKFGLFTLIFVVGRLLIIDVWGMELTGKIITFFMIGILFAGPVLLRRQPPIQKI